jgi:hypothetical protein
MDMIRTPWALIEHPGNSMNGDFLIYAAECALSNVRRSHGARPLASVD